MDDQEVEVKAHVYVMIRNASGAMLAFSVAVLLFMFQTSLSAPELSWSYAPYLFVISMPCCASGYVIASGFVHRQSVARSSSNRLDRVVMVGLALPIAGFSMVIDAFSESLSIVYFFAVALGFLVTVASLRKKKLETDGNSAGEE